MDFMLNHHLLFQGCRFVQKKHPWKKNAKKLLPTSRSEYWWNMFGFTTTPGHPPPNGVSVVKLRTLDQALALRRLRKRHSAECGARGASKQGLSRSALEGEVSLLVLKGGFSRISSREFFVVKKSWLYFWVGRASKIWESFQSGRKVWPDFWSLPNLEFKTTELRIMVQWPLTFWLSGEDGLYRWDFRFEQIGGPGRTQDVGNPWIQFPALVARHVSGISRCKQGINSEKP